MTDNDNTCDCCDTPTFEMMSTRSLEPPFRVRNIIDMIDEMGLGEAYALQLTGLLPHPRNHTPEKGTWHAVRATLHQPDLCLRAALLAAIGNGAKTATVSAASVKDERIGEMEAEVEVARQREESHCRGWRLAHETVAAIAERTNYDERALAGLHLADRIDAVCNALIKRNDERVAGLEVDLPELHAARDNQAQTIGNQMTIIEELRAAVAAESALNEELRAAVVECEKAVVRTTEDKRNMAAQVAALEAVKDKQAAEIERLQELVAAG